MTISNELKEFIKNHLTDIDIRDNIIELTFDTNNLYEELQTFPNWKLNAVNKSYFHNTRSKLQNNDPIEALRNVKEILRVAVKNIKTPNRYYDMLMKQVLTVGAPYSSFVELLLTNMFLTNKKLNTLWRYNQQDVIKFKLGDKTLASKTSPLLDLLYQQNKKTIKNIEFIDDYINSDDLTIYEKLFLEKF